MPEQRRGETWLITFKFPDMASAGRSYRIIRDAVLGRDLDLSVFRVQVVGVPHVVVVGEREPTEAIRKQVEEACKFGELTTLPPEVKEALEERRRQGKLQGAFWEANYGVGMVYPTRRERRHPPKP